MSEQVSDPHVLTILGCDEGLYDYEIEHPPSCKYEVWTSLPGETFCHPDHKGLLFERVWTCIVQHEIDNIGLDDLTDMGKVKLDPGEYMIEGWAAHYPSTPMTGEEWDSGLAFVEASIPKEETDG